MHVFNFVGLGYRVDMMSFWGQLFATVQEVKVLLWWHKLAIERSVKRQFRRQVCTSQGA